MSKTYYLTTDISAIGKKLANLTGWEKEAAELLVSSDEGKVDKLMALIRLQVSEEDTSNRIDADELIALLPRNIRSRARIYLHHPERFLKVTAQGHVRTEPIKGTRPRAALARPRPRPRSAVRSIARSWTRSGSKRPRRSCRQG